MIGMDRGTARPAPAGAVLIRRAGPDDAPAIVAVLAEVAAEGRWIASEGAFDVDERTERMRAAIARGEDVIWVIEDTSRIAGFGALHPGSAPGVPSLGMALVAGARGAGLGRRLLRTLLEHAEATGAHKVELEVWPDNGRAIALYVAHGFEIEGVRRDHYRRRDGTLRSAILMARRVPGPPPAG
jgi:putative acetyltransferase